MKQDEGMIHKVLGLYCVVFVIFCYILLLEMRKVEYFKSQLEDVLVESNLAAALVDVYQYGRSDEICFINIEESYSLIKWMLEEDLKIENLAMEAQKIEVLECRFYEMHESDVTEYIFDETGMVSARQHPSTDILYTPNHSLVETSTVYSKIAVEYELLGIKPMYVEMEQSVDIIKNS